MKEYVVEYVLLLCFVSPLKKTIRHSNNGLSLVNLIGSLYTSTQTILSHNISHITFHLYSYTVGVTMPQS